MGLSLVRQISCKSRLLLAIDWVRSSIFSKQPNDHVSEFWGYNTFSNMKLAHGKPLGCEIFRQFFGEQIYNYFLWHRGLRLEPSYPNNTASRPVRNRNSPCAKAILDKYYRYIYIYQVKVPLFIFQTYHGLYFKSCLHRSLHNTEATIPTLTTIGHQYAKTTKTTTASQGDTQDDQFGLI